MRQWLDRAGRGLESFMRGRYGLDALGTALYIVSFALMLLSVLFQARWLSYLALLPLVWEIFRGYSRNIEARARENETWRRLSAPVRRTWRLWRDRWTDRRTHRYFKCPRCRQMMRVPKGRGRIEITCRSCGEKFQRTS